MQHKKQTGSRDLPPLQIGDTVKLLSTENNTWSKDGVVSATLPHRSYLVQTESGTLRRNRQMLRSAPAEQQHCETSYTPYETPSADHTSTTETTATGEPGKHNHDSSMASPSVSTSNKVSTAPPVTTRSGRVVKPPTKLDL